jgi:ABC-type xylose transport system substrate-binding protein
MMKIHRRSLAAALACAPLAGLLPLPAWAQKPIVLGFSQVGAESEWRTANTESIKSAAKDAGIELKFSDAQQKQENQIKAIRSFIAQKVDVIAFSPVVESGWETVLREAKAARIPVVLTDRSVNVKDTSLYVSFMGSDFVEEGRKAGRWLVEKMKGSSNPVNIVELQGTVGSAPAIDRKKGFEEKGTIGIAMPTKSSARWIDDGNNMVKVLKERGYGTDLQYADDDIPNQLSQIENMVTKGVKVLVIAAIDGTTLSERAAEGGRQGHQGHRLRPPDPRLEERRLLRHLRQLPGRRAAGQLHRRQARPEGGQGPVQHRAVRRLAGRQQRLLLLRRRDVGAQALHRQRQARGAQPARWAWTRSARCAGTAPAQARMDNLLSAFYGKDKVNAVLSPYDGLSIGILSSLKGVGYGTASQPLPGRERPGRRSAVGQVDPARRAVFHDLQGHPRARQGHGQHGRRLLSGKQPESTTPRPTTTASRSSRPTC